MDLLIDNRVSTEERLFVTAIRTDPDSGTRHQSRLVYADWLEENGRTEAAEAQRRLVRLLRIVERYRRGASLMDALPEPRA